MSSEGWSVEVRRKDLIEAVQDLTGSILGDGRWSMEGDDLGVQVLGMLLYGFALAKGRMALFLDLEDVDAALLSTLTEQVRAAEKWSGGLVAEARASAFDPNHHDTHFALIGVGHSYYGAPDRRKVVENVFRNIRDVRRTL